MPRASRTINKKHLTFNFLKSVVSCQLSVVRKAKGFTLIELLIVITIIGILASLTLASYGNAQAKGRDGVRKSDLAQMKRALELAKSDCTGAAWYPVITGYTSDVDHYNKLATYFADTDLNYISSEIKDPSNNATTGQVYAYKTTGASGTANKCPDEVTLGNFNKDGAASYALWVKLERASDAQSLDSRTKCATKPNPDNANWTLAAYAGYFVICNN